MEKILADYRRKLGEFGEELVGQSLFTPAEVRRRKLEVKALLHSGLTAGGSRKADARTK